MTYKKGYIPREDRKKILFISDSIIGISGVANVAREIVVGCAHRYNFFSIGVLQDPKAKGHGVDLCESINKEIGIPDSNVKTVQWDSYDDPEFLKQVIEMEKPDAMVFITDPRYYQRLFDLSHDIQHGKIGGKPIPMCYIQIWDEFTPPFYNRAAWSSVNMSLCISKQTLLMNKIVLGERAEHIDLKYFPHGVNTELFKPVAKDNEELINLKKDLFKGKEYDFVLFFNSRNIHRKNIPTALLGFKAFLRKLSPEQAVKCCFVLHTQPIDHNGTDLYAVVDTLLGPNKDQVIFDGGLCAVPDLNLRYNLSDATVIVSEAEGFGLSGLESLAAGTPIIANITGGVQDYCNFRDEDGKWFTPNEKVWSNHNKTYTEAGPWVYPVFPSALTLVGSVPTPYIFSSRCDFKDVADQMHAAYLSGYEYRKAFGLKAREWIMTDEVGMTTKHMCTNFISHIDNMLATWEPIERFSVIPLDGTETLNHVEIPDYLFQRN